jgi:hypothetical protein
MVFLNRTIVLVCVATVLACRPDLSERQSFVAGPTVLAIRSDPAEAETTSPVSLSALVVDPSGGTPTMIVDWAICKARKPLAELEPVNPICTQRVGDFLIPLGQGTNAGGKVPSDACRLFGPEVPAPKPGEPFGRPTDPDTTGGYYLPIRVILDANPDQRTLGTTRLSCGVAGASSGDATEFRAHYHINGNPTVAALTVNGVAAGTDDASASVVGAGSQVHFEVDWPKCPDTDACGDGVCGPDETEAACDADCGGDTPKSCGGAERYFYYDTEALHNVTRRESIRASWFTTAGSYAVDISGREETDPASNATNTLTVPTSPQKIYGWVVLRDSRGGVAWQKFVLNVQ